MSEIKFRYVFQNLIFTKEFSSCYLNLEEIEKGYVRDLMSSGMLQNGYRLIAKNRYTELKDKNNKEIYEGDIVKTSEANGCINQTVVCFVDGCFELSFITDKKRDYLKCYVVNHAVEIIGNIYKNPELMENKK